MSRLVSQPPADLYPRLRLTTSCQHIALGKHTRAGRQEQRWRQTQTGAQRMREVGRQRERQRERERKKGLGGAPRCRRCVARRIVAAPTTGSQLWPLLVAPSARRVAHRCGARETDCVPCAPAPRPPLLRSVASYAWASGPCARSHSAHTPRSHSAHTPDSPPGVHMACKSWERCGTVQEEVQLQYHMDTKQSPKTSEAVTLLSSLWSPCHPPSRQCTPLMQATDSSTRVSPSSSATMAGHVKKFKAQSGQQKLGTPFSSLALSPRSPPPARHTPPKPAAPSPSLPDSAASLGRPAWQAAVRGVLMGQKRRPEVHVQVGAQRGTAARDGGARLGVHRGARPGRGGGGVYGRRG